MKQSLYYGLIVLLLVWLPWSAGHATADELTGQKLAQKVFDRDRGKTAVSTSQMVLINKSGTKRVRHFTTKRIEENGLERQLTRFTAPADIDGTGFLTVEKPGWETEQFLYLPALKRTRRIVSSQKSHRFVNSDFTYEDLERRPVSNYLHKLNGLTQIDNLDCYVLESRPKEGIESQYGLMISMVAKGSLIPIHVKYYDRKERHIKTYKVLKLEQIQGIWTEVVVSMEDHIKNNKTYVKQETVEYNTNITPESISRNSLENY